MSNLVPTLWAMALLSSAALAALSSAPLCAGAGRTAFVIATPALAALLIVLGGLLGPSVGQSGAAYLAMLGVLPLLACLLGGHAAAQSFLGWPSGRQGSAFPRWVAVGSLITACGIAAIIAREGGPVYPVAGLAAFVLAWAGARALAPDSLRRLRLTSALCLLWSGAFLVYLMILPSQVAGSADGADGGLPQREAGVIWFILLTAFLFGLLRRQRG